MLSGLFRPYFRAVFQQSYGGFSSRLASSTVQAENLTVRHSEKDCEFYIELQDQTGNRTKAYLRYSKLGDSLDLRSTVVPPAFEGQGIAKVLAKAAFDHCVENKKNMKLTCWYLDEYLKRHPEENYTKLVI